MAEPLREELPWQVRALAALPVGVAWLRQERFAWVNDAFCALLGRAPQEILGHSSYELMTPADAARVRQRYLELERGENSPESFEINVLLADGSQAVLELEPRLLAPGEVVVVARGLGDRVRDRELLLALGELAAGIQREHSVAAVVRAAAEGLRALGLDTLVLRLEGESAFPMAVAVRADTRKLLEDATGAALEDLRLPVQQVPNIHRALRDRRPVFVDDGAVALRNLVAALGREWSEALEAGRRAVELDRLVHVPLPVGRGLWGLLRVSGGQLRSNDAAAIALFGAQLASMIEAVQTIEDLEAKNRRLEAIHRLTLHDTGDCFAGTVEALLKVVVEAARCDAAAMFVLDGGGGHLDLAGITGYRGPLEEKYRRVPLSNGKDGGFPLGGPPRAVGPEQWPPEARADVEGAGISQTALVPLVVDGRASGLVALLRRAPQRFTAEELCEAQTLVALVALQVERSRLYQDLKHSYHQLACAQAELVKSERLAALGELSALVAHEVRNPLGAIANSVAALRRLPPDPERQRMLLDIVEEESERLNRMVSDLLDFARPAEPRLKEEPLEQIVLAALESAAHGFSEGEAPKVRAEICPDLPAVRVDAELLRQALVNLITNALQACPAGAVTVRTRLCEVDGLRTAAVEVVDKGPGVPKELRERIFQPFFTTRAAGTGLGLAVVKRIADAHRAEVRVDCPAEGGATFSLILPL